MKDHTSVLVKTIEEQQNLNVEEQNNFIVKL